MDAKLQIALLDMREALIAAEMVNNMARRDENLGGWRMDYQAFHGEEVEKYRIAKERAETLLAEHQQRYDQKKMAKLRSPHSGQEAEGEK